MVLLSGGLDSATALAWAQAQGYACSALSFLYGQRHAVELECARELAAAHGVSDHQVATIDLRAFGGSALTADIAVPKDRDLDSDEIPVTYVPARNTIFLSYALAMAEVRGAFAIVTGMNAVDYSGYPDCRPEYVRAWETMANLATKAAVEGAGRIEVLTPLIDWSKERIVREGRALGVDFGMTSSCYDPGAAGEPCGHCDSCVHRARAFGAIGVPDPRVERFR